MPALDALLAQSNAVRRSTLTITASYHQPDRLRVLEIDPPAYEARASTSYLRGDIARIQGRQGVSCGIDLSSRWGVPALRQELQSAAARADQFVVLRVPSRNHDLIEIISDAELNRADEDVLPRASLAAASEVLVPEDFSDWER